MAIAAAALAPDLLKNLTPAEAMQQLKAIEDMAAEARSITLKVAHSASLTEQENYIGWLPLLFLLYQFYQNFVKPQIEFTLNTQIGIADVLNKFGANIDTQGLRNVSSRIQKFGTVTATGPSPSKDTGGWEVNL